MVLSRETRENVGTRDEESLEAIFRGVSFINLSREEEEEETVGETEREIEKPIEYLLPR